MSGLLGVAAIGWGWECRAVGIVQANAHPLRLQARFIMYI